MDIQTLVNQFLDVIQAQSNTTDGSKAAIGVAFSDFLTFIQFQGFTVTITTTPP